MFTWNIQYISKTRLADALKQSVIDTERGDILIRIHTAIHNAEEAVDLAAFIKKIVPKAHIIGTSTSAVIHEGKLHMDQCLISVTQMTHLVPLYDEIYNKKNRSYFEALEKKAEELAKKYDCRFVDNETPYERVEKGHPTIVDYFYHEEVRGTANSGKRNVIHNS